VQGAGWINLKSMGWIIARGSLRALVPVCARGLNGPETQTITVYDISAYNSAIYIGVMEYRTCERSGELSGRVRKNDGTGAEQGARASWNGN